MSSCTGISSDDWHSQRVLYENQLNTINENLGGSASTKDKASRDLDALLNTINTYINAHCINVIQTNNLVSAQITRLEDTNESLKTDVESALARDELLRSRDSNISSHKLFLLDRPIRRNMIPYLWIFSIICIGVGLLIFKVMAPTIVAPENIWLTITTLFSSIYVLYAILGASLIVILFLSLKIAGVLGK